MPMLLLIIIMIIGAAVIGIMMLIVGGGAAADDDMVVRTAGRIWAAAYSSAATSGPRASKPLELKGLLLYRGEWYTG